ncbi:MAG: DNA-directed RNA polymerase subunit omega [Chthoniobacterales bacterium]
MNSHYIEEAAKVITETPILINMVSKRVRQLNAGARPMVEVLPRMDVQDIALAEIAAGKVVLVKQEPVDGTK